MILELLILGHGYALILHICIYFAVDVKCMHSYSMFVTES